MKKAGDVISALFKENFGSEFVETARSSADLFSSWAEIVAEAWKNPEHAAASHSRICELEKGQLLVEADHPGWIMTLQTRQHELLESAQRKYPGLGIKSLAFKLSREPF